MLSLTLISTTYVGSISEASKFARLSTYYTASFSEVPYRMQRGSVSLLAHVCSRTSLVMNLPFDLLQMFVSVLGAADCNRPRFPKRFDWGNCKNIEHYCSAWYLGKILGTPSWRALGRVGNSKPPDGHDSYGAHRVDSFIHWAHFLWGVGAHVTARPVMHTKERCFSP